MDSVSKKVILITGGAVGIGRIFARGLKDSKLIIHYHSSEKEAFELQGELRQEKNDICLFHGDLSKAADIDKLFECIQNQHGTLDVLINNAASYEPTNFSESLRFEDTFNLNLKAPLLCAQKAALMMPEGSCIINICDNSAKYPFKGFALHSISKAALLYSTKALALELAPKIRVNTLLLGAMRPSKHDTREKYQQLLDRYVLLKRPPKDSEIVKALSSILDNPYLNGTTIELDGGWRF